MVHLKSIVLAFMAVVCTGQTSTFDLPNHAELMELMSSLTHVRGEKDGSMVREEPNYTALFSCNRMETQSDRSAARKLKDSETLTANKTIDNFADLHMYDDMFIESKNMNTYSMARHNKQDAVSATIENWIWFNRETGVVSWLATGSNQGYCSGTYSVPKTKMSSLRSRGTVEPAGISSPTSTQQWMNEMLSTSLSKAKEQMSRSHTSSRVDPDPVPLKFHHEYITQGASACQDLTCIYGNYMEFNHAGWAAVSPVNDCGYITVSKSYVDDDIVYTQFMNAFVPANWTYPSWIMTSTTAYDRELKQLSFNVGSSDSQSNNCGFFVA